MMRQIEESKINDRILAEAIVSQINFIRKIRFPSAESILEELNYEIH